MIRRDNINVLIACEESQAECEAFRKQGFRAFSCDLQPARKGTPGEWHIVGDVTPYLHGKSHFVTQDGKLHKLSMWHLIIAHPPCTYLCKVGSVHMIKDGKINAERFAQMEFARDFFFECLNADAPFVAVENPLPMRRAGLPVPDCYIQPYWFGVKYSKKTLYWLRNLPPIMANAINPCFKSFVGASRGKYRSRTFPSVARALAKQWGDYVYTQLNYPNVKV